MLDDIRIANKENLLKKSSNMTTMTELAHQEYKQMAHCQKFGTSWWDARVIKVTKIVI